jgi:CheY-like chemotaxis protein/nitrogen-specific signal transduction histidine kinase
MIGQNVDPDDPAPGSIWILDDIDRDKALEDGLRAARQSAEAASRAKDAFLANMSHELRTPLNSVLGFVQILEQDGRLDEAQRRQVQAIGVGGERLLGLINEVLDLTRIEAGRLELRPVTWDSGELLDELSQMFRVRAERKGIALIVEPAADLPRRLTCDLKCLHQVLLNLLDNAVKFTDRGGVTLGVAVEDGSLLVTVADTGAGIPADRLPSIFEPFQQAGDAGSRAQGLGLGLAISRGLVERMGGSLSVESTAGAGCTFRARVPVQTAAPAGEGAPQAPEAGRIAGYRRTEGSGPFRILVADDQAENREVLRALLAALGFDVAEAATGRECLERAVARPPDLILMDLRMPELDGIEATGRLRKEDRTRHVPIVAVTAAAFAEDREGALVAGCDAHLPKPVHLGALAGVLEALLPLRWDRLPAAPGEGLPPATEVLPAEQAARFARLVETGNLTGVATLAEELARSGRYPVLARRMAVLAEEFDLAALRRLLPASGGDGGDAAG